jgi:hypothetical protein
MNEQTLVGAVLLGARYRKGHSRDLRNLKTLMLRTVNGSIVKLDVTIKQARINPANKPCG